LNPGLLVHVRLDRFLLGCSVFFLRLLLRSLHQVWGWRALCGSSLEFAGFFQTQRVLHRFESVCVCFFSMARRLPPGFRFHPTDQELVAFYLKRKVCGKRIEFDVVAEVDLYKCEPWDLPCKSWRTSERHSLWTFFCHGSCTHIMFEEFSRSLIAWGWETVSLGCLLKRKPWAQRAIRYRVLAPCCG
jgi:hypothetical protein